MNIVSTGQMRAQSISLQVTTRDRCNAACKCCISRTTPNTAGEQEFRIKREISKIDLYKGLDFARRLGATHAILTGKAEPTQEHPDYIHNLINICRRQGFLVDMHTNGYLIQKGKYELEQLVARGLTMITFSVFSQVPEVHRSITSLDVDFPSLIRKANSLGLLVRVSLVLTETGVGSPDEVLAFIKEMGQLGVHMVVIRQIWMPEFRAGRFNEEVYKWNRENFVPLSSVYGDFGDLAKRRHKDVIWETYPIYELAPLPWGARVFAMEGCFDDPEHGVNITFAYCEENDKGPVMKSIVHKPNGHGYRNWDFNANILY